MMLRDIWEKFVEFEANVGDLASLLKVEKRRATALRADTCQVRPYYPPFEFYTIVMHVVYSSQ